MQDTGFPGSFFECRPDGISIAPSFHAVEAGTLRFPVCLSSLHGPFGQKQFRRSRHIVHIVPDHLRCPDPHGNRRGKPETLIHVGQRWRREAVA